MPALFQRDPYADETRLSYALRRGPLNYLEGIFGPGGRADVLHGGAFGPQGIFTTPLARDLASGWNYLQQPQAPNAPKPAPFTPAPAEQGPAPFSAEAVQSMAQWARNRGGTVTSINRDPGKNQRVGGVANSFHLTGRAFDSVPPKGTSMADWAGELRGKFPGWDVINEKDHVHIEPPGSAGAAGPFNTITQAMRISGLDQGIPPVRTGGYDQLANTYADLARKAQQPVAFTVPEQPGPPAPTHFTGPDYTAADESFAAAAPQNPFGASPEEQERAKLKMRRGEYFAAMGQMLASVNFSGGAGIGELFAKLGGGALMGLRSGNKMVDDKMEAFDRAMQAYTLAKANKDEGRAREAANLVNDNIRLDNHHAEQVYAHELKQTETDFKDGMLYTKVRDGKGGIQWVGTPIDPLRGAQYKVGEAEARVAKDSSLNNRDYLQFQVDRSLRQSIFSHVLSNPEDFDPQTRGQAAAWGIVEGATAGLKTGSWRETYNKVFGVGSDRQLEEQAWDAAGVDLVKGPKGNLVPMRETTKEQEEVFNRFLSNRLVGDMSKMNKAWMLRGGMVQEMRDGKPTGKQMYQPADPNIATAVEQMRQEGRRTSTRFGPRGATTTVSESGY